MGKGDCEKCPAIELIPEIKTSDVFVQVKRIFLMFIKAII